MHPQEKLTFENDRARGFANEATLMVFPCRACLQEATKDGYDQTIRDMKDFSSESFNNPR
jgi:hypothetical protein